MREEIVGVFDALDDDMDRLLELSFDVSSHCGFC